MTRSTGAVRVPTDDPGMHKKPKWPWVLLAFLALLILLLIVFFAMDWISVDFSGGDVDVEEPTVDVDTDLPDVDVDPGELPDVDVEDGSG